MGKFAKLHIVLFLIFLTSVIVAGTTSTNGNLSIQKGATISDTSSFCDNVEKRITAVEAKIDTVTNLVRNEKKSYLEQNVYPLLPLIGTLIAALLGLLISYVSIRANVISKARIEWVQALRNLMCEYIALLNDYQDRVDHLLSEKKAGRLVISETITIQDAWALPLFKAKLDIQTLNNKIRLFLNNNDESAHIELVKLSDQLIENLVDLDDIKSSVQDVVFILIKNEFLNKSRAILKTEWDKAKSEAKIPLPKISFLWVSNLKVWLKEYAKKKGETK